MHGQAKAGADKRGVGTPFTDRHREGLYPIPATAPSTLTYELRPAVAGDAAVGVVLTIIVELERGRDGSELVFSSLLRGARDTVPSDARAEARGSGAARGAVSETAITGTDDDDIAGGALVPVPPARYRR